MVQDNTPTTDLDFGIDTPPLNIVFHEDSQIEPSAEIRYVPQDNSFVFILGDTEVVRITKDGFTVHGKAKQTQDELHRVMCNMFQAIRLTLEEEK